MRRVVLLLGTLYVVAALAGLTRERRGEVTCGCAQECWCKRPVLSLFRWVLPLGHKPG